MTSFKVSIRWPRTVTTKPKTSWQIQNTSRQNRKPHVKNKTLTAKPKTSREKQNISRQNQKRHGKTKDLTAKPNTSQQKPNTLRQKQIPTAKPKLFCSRCEVFGFAVSFLVLLWGILFLLWGFWLCRDVFVFAVRFLVLPWQLWTTIVRSEVFLLYR